MKPENPPPTPCDQELAKAIALWREQHKLREDDAVLLLVQLLKIHQQHWMELWKQQMPPLENLHHDVLALLQLNKSLQTQGQTLSSKLTRAARGKAEWKVSLSGAGFACVSCILAGYIWGKVFV